ncbi:MAG: M28 family peptidase [Rhodospirillaceae bacterium]
MQRRTFVGLSAAALVSPALSHRAFAASASPSDTEKRVARWLQTFDSQGNHRTATAGDHASAEWLVAEAKSFGVEAALENFPLERVDVQAAYVTIGDRRIEGVPMHDAGFTGPDGISGKIGALGSDADIALIESEPYTPSQPGLELTKQVAEARKSNHKAIVILTRGSHSGLYLLNAMNFREPSGPPMLQVSSMETEWLKAQAANRSAATVVAHAVKSAAKASNVVARVAGGNPKLAPIGVMGPRSAWWQGVTEQGSRMVCLLETMRTVAAAMPARDVHFAALSGHELGALGVDSYVEAHTALVSDALVWMFFGSDIGTPNQPHVLHASDSELEAWAVNFLKAQGLTVDQIADQKSRARGEAGWLQRGGGKFVTLAGASHAYHNINDRWPEAPDVKLLSRYVRAIADGVLGLANTAG